MAALTVITLAVLCHGLVSRRLETTIVTAPMIFVAVGLLTGPEALGLAQIDLESEEVIVLAELTLSVVLFSDAVRIDPRLLRRFVGIPGRMLGLGLPMVIGLGTIIARTTLGIGWASAALLASILAATDAALGQAVLTDESVPTRIRDSLNVESGLNDGLALPAVTLFIAVTTAERASESTTFWIRFVAEQIVLGAVSGVLVGAGVGWLLIRARRSGWVDGIDGQLAALAQVGLAFALAHAIGGNAFIAAFVAGIAFRVVGDGEAEHLTEFAEDGGQLLASITFVVFGNALLGPALGDITLPIALCVVATLTAGRMIPIALSVLGMGLRAPTIVFLGWFGPRGLASILFALTVIEETDRGVEDELFVVVAWTVFASVVLHGVSAGWGARRYGAWYDAHRSQHDRPEELSEGPVEDGGPTTRPRWGPRSREVSD